MRSGPYRLWAMISHLGSSGVSGHYISHCWHGGDRYSIYDDGVVRETTWPNFITEASQRQAYVLAYVRVGFWGAAAADGSEQTPYARDPVSLKVAAARKQWMVDESQAGQAAPVHSSPPFADDANASSSASTGKAGSKPSASSSQVGSGSLSSPICPATASLPEPPPAKKARRDKRDKNDAEAETRRREEAPQGRFVEGASVTCSKGHRNLSPPNGLADAALPAPPLAPPPAKRARRSKTDVDNQAQKSCRDEVLQGPFFEGGQATCSKNHALVARNVGPSRKAGFDTHCDRCQLQIVKGRSYRCDSCSDDCKEDFCESCVREVASLPKVAKRACKAPEK